MIVTRSYRPVAVCCCVFLKYMCITLTRGSAQLLVNDVTNLFRPRNYVVSFSPTSWCKREVIIYYFHECHSDKPWQMLARNSTIMNQYRVIFTHVGSNEKLVRSITALCCSSYIDLHDNIIPSFPVQRHRGQLHGTLKYNCLFASQHTQAWMNQVGILATKHHVLGACMSRSHAVRAWVGGYMCSMVH